VAGEKKQDGTHAATDNKGSAINTTDLDRTRTWIAVSIFVSFPVLLVALLVSLGILLYVVISHSGEHLATGEKMALAGSIQVSVGMVMGFISVFIGLMMTWFGINAAFEFNGKSSDKVDVSLKSASPGLLFFLGGVLLIGFSLYKPITYEEPGMITSKSRVGEPKQSKGAATSTLPPTSQAEK